MLWPIRIAVMVSGRRILSFFGLRVRLAFGYSLSRRRDWRSLGNADHQRRCEWWRGAKKVTPSCRCCYPRALRLVHPCLYLKQGDNIALDQGWNERPRIILTRGCAVLVESR